MTNEINEATRAELTERWRRALVAVCKGMNVPRIIVNNTKTIIELSYLLKIATTKVQKNKESAKKGIHKKRIIFIDR